MCLQSIVKHIVAFLNQWLLGGDGCCCFYCYLCVLLRNQTHNIQMDNIAPRVAVQCFCLPFFGNPIKANISAYICSMSETYSLMQGRLKIWTSNSFFAIYKQGPLLILKYLINGSGYRCAS